MSNKKIELIGLLEESARRSAEILYLTVFKSFYGWQKDFVRATKDFHECCLCAANQIGKTYTGTDIDAMHLLGDYPDDWDGHEFDFPPMCWGLGYSMEKTRDLLQTALFGKYLSGEFEGGLVPKGRILWWESATGTPNAMRTVRVKHKYGESTVQFWSYSQGSHAIMGDVVDFIHVDEEPKDQTIRPQLLTRSINGDKGKGGRIIYTFTPENGKTELVSQFMDDPSPDQFFMMKGWADAPHMTKEKMERLLAQYPAYQRDMRSKGMPLMGSGLIYEVSDDDLKVDPFNIPDYWFVINGMDFGWDHPQAHIQMVWDRDADIFYVVNAWKGSKKQPFEAWHVVKPWAENVPTAWPGDGLQTEKGSARQQKDYYEEEGFKLLPNHATWEDGGVGVWAGIMEINNLMKTGRLKIVSSLFEMFEEIRQYHTKTTANGKIEIVKTRDDLLDACFHQDTEVMTKDGPVKIIDLVETEGEIVSINGRLQKYKNCRLTRRNAELITITFSDGYKVTCTPDHKFLTVNGWKDAVHLHDELIIQVGSSCQSYSTELNTPNLGIIIGRLGSSCIGRYGRIIMELSRRSIISTMLTATQKTTRLPILNALNQLSIFRIIVSSGKTLSLCVKNAMVFFIPKITAITGSVAIDANQSLGVKAGLMMSQGSALGVQKNLKQTNTRNRSIVAGVAREKTGLAQSQEKRTLSVLRVESAPKADVYCMEVDETHAFALANGAIVHNCRYAYMMRRFAIRICDLYPDERAYQPPKRVGRDTRTGY